MSDNPKKDACATFIEQTKLLVTLASTFILAPAAFVALLKEKEFPLPLFVWSEVCFIASVIGGYLTLATIAGWQNEGKYDVYRPGTRIASACQFVLFLVGCFLFLKMIHCIA